MNELVDDLNIDPVAEPGRAEEIKKQVRELPFTIVDSNWPGNELVEIVHLNGRAIVKINHRHPFIREIYDPIKTLANGDATSINTGDVIRLARKAEAALDVLFMAYAKAENMHRNPDDAYGELRSDWGKCSASYVRGLRSE